MNVRHSFMTAVALLCATTMGCSYIFIRQPANRRFTERDACTESRLAPGADTVIATAGALYVGIGTGASGAGSRHPAFPLVAALLVALPWALSAAHGYRYTDRCREAHHPAQAVQTAPPSGSADVAPGTEGHRCVETLTGGACDTGLTCDDSYCVRLPGAGERCNGPCQRGFLCRGQRCEELPARPAAPSTPPETPAPEAPAAEEPVPETPVPRPMRGEGEACEPALGPGDCNEGLECLDGSCVRDDD